MSTYLISTIYVTFRLLPLLVVTPVEAIRRAPILVRIVLSLAIALVLAAVVPVNPEATAKLSMSILVSEFLLGAVLAFSFHVVAAVIHFVGQLIDMQMGFIAGAVFDPSSQQMAGPMSRILGMSLAVTFFAAGFHYVLLDAFKQLYNYIPAGSLFGLQAKWYAVVARLFAFGFILASPIIIVLSLVDISLAIVSRSLPQAQIYFVALPLKVGIGIVTMAIFMNTAAKPLLDMLMQGLHSWDSMLLVG